MSPSQKQHLESPGLPLAVYREIAAHLRQVTGVDAGLTPHSSHHFDYNQSQVGSLWIQHASDLDPTCQQQLDQILAYYGDRFGPWIRKVDRPDLTEV